MKQQDLFGEPAAPKPAPERKAENAAAGARPVVESLSPPPPPTRAPVSERAAPPPPVAETPAPQTPARERSRAPSNATAGSHPPAAPPPTVPSDRTSDTASRPSDAAPRRAPAPATLVEALKATAPLAPAAPQTPKQPRVMTVSEVTWQLKQTIEPKFARVLVRGEVSDFRGANTRGHLYFSIKDDGATLGVTMWQSTAKALKFAIKNGLSVVVDGSIDVYEPAGRYSLIVQRIEPEGVGALALAFEQLKSKLLAEGLIGDRRKKPRQPLPSLPRRIGVVTSITGAALRDFLKVLHRRHPRLSVLVVDARVQGDGAAIDVAKGIRRLGRTNVDVIVVTRGGGSLEDLWAFNEEIVVRAIYDAAVPVVSAIGHEIDVTLSDLVADYRAPTPSAAAEALAPVLADLELLLSTMKRRAHRAVERRIMGASREVGALKGRLGDPRRMLGQRRLRLNDAAESMARAFRRQHRDRTQVLRALEKRLQRARPQARLQVMRAELDRLHKRLQRASPMPRLAASHQKLDALKARLPRALTLWLKHERASLASERVKLLALSPLAVLGRGYAIVYGPRGEIIRTGEEVSQGETLRVRLSHDAELSATVTGKKPSKGSGT